jgi:hypothetical protein
VRSVAVHAAHIDAAEAREELLHVAVFDREADMLEGGAPDARHRRVWVEAQLGLQPWCAFGRQLAKQVTALLPSLNVPLTSNLMLAMADDTTRVCPG